MTRTGGSKKVQPEFSTGRANIARTYRGHAQNGLDLIEEGEIANPIVSNIVIAAIGYADALTARFSGRINQGDHAAVVKLLRDTFGNQMSRKQETSLQRILAQKDLAQYQARSMTRADAEALMRNLDDFADWAEGKLAE